MEKIHKKLLNYFSKTKNYYLIKMGICCSCICCNSCQTCGCCGYQPSKVKFDPENPSWMKTLAEKNPKLLLRDTINIGTHNSGTHSISRMKCCSSLSRYQSLTVYRQMTNGVRFLDFRLGGRSKGKDKISIFHNKVKGTSYVKILAQVIQFNQFYPKEFIMINLIHEKGTKLNNEQKEYIYNLTIQELGEIAVTSTDFENGFKLDTVTIKEAVDHKKKILILADESLRNFTLNNKKTPPILELSGYHDSKKIIDKFMYKTEDPEEIMKKNLENITSKKKTRNLYIISQMSLEGGDCSDILSVMFCCRSIRPDNLAGKLAKDRKLEYFFRKNSKENWNFLWFDFVEFTPYLNRYLLGLNYTNFELRVKKAAVRNSKKKVDVTRIVQNFVEMSRNNSLFIVEFESDFKLDYIDIRNGWFTLFYEFVEKNTGESTTGICNFKFKKSTKFLLNMINKDSQGEKYETGGELKGAFHGKEHYRISEGDGELDKFKLKRKNDDVLNYTVKPSGEVQFNLS